MIYVLYHKNCMDGKGAAYAAHMKFGESATYIEVAYGETIPDVSDATEIYILDFSYPKEILYKMAETAKVVVLDHHKSAQKDLEGVEFAQFDMNRSGAQMAWDYFHPNVPRPIHIDHIGDRDLWKFEKADTKAYSIAAMSKIKQFTDLYAWKSYELVEIGRDLLDFQNSQIELILTNSYLSEYSGYKVAVVNSPILQSELGNLLLTKYPEADFSMVYRKVGDETFVSLRSEDGRVDVSEVAKKFGGGGHRNAAGMTLKGVYL